MEKLLVVFGKPKTFLVCCFLIFSWAAIGLFSGITLWLERIIYDSQENFFAFRRKPNPNIIIVDIDSETFESQGTSWPWPRGKLAELLNIIESGAPRFVVIDILLQFPDPYEQGKGDLALEESMKKFGNVALVSLTEENISPHGSEIRLISNLRKFRQSALLEGFVWGIVDSDSSLRSFNLSDSRLGIESCVLQIAKNLDRRFGEGFSETGESQESRIAFSKKDGGIPFLSAHDLFSGNVDPSTLKEKIVFLGVSAAILHDYHQTPLGIIPGVEILASSLDTIISKRTGAIKKELSWRLGSAILGGAFGLFIMGNLGLYTIAISIVLLLFVLVLGVFVSSYFVFFPPFAPFVLSWIFVSIIVFGIEYFFSFLETQFSKAEAKAAGNIQERFFPKEGWESPQG
ncbi:CHASE2 domain-containing protein, partial [bacterium]|nr:CHASE2 domain-containing protein [bacterium]